MLNERLLQDYEKTSQITLMRNLPVVIKVKLVDSKIFTKGFTKPFDDVFLLAMEHTAIDLYNNIPSALFCFAQNDEFVVVMKDLGNDNWFGGNTMQIASYAASIATLNFTNHFFEFASELEMDKYLRKIWSGTFTATCFNLPNYEEVDKYIIWRQASLKRDALTQLMQMYYGKKSTNGCSLGDIELFLDENGILWEETPDMFYTGKIVCKFVYNGIVRDHHKNIIRPINKANGFTVPDLSDDEENYHYIYDICKNNGIRV